MSVGELIVLGGAIGANNLAVALALGALGQWHRRWRVVGTFAVSEFTIPLVGLAIGSAVSQVLAGAGQWVGAGLLAGFGLWNLRPDRDPRRDERLARRVTTWRGLAILAVGLGLDNLVVGFSIGIPGGVSPLALAATIAAFAVVFTLAGMRLGSEGRRRWEAVAQRGSGAVLVLLALAVASGALA